MKKLLLLIIVAASCTALTKAQNSINIHSIATLRQPFGDGGYTLDGGQMFDSRSKLLNPTLFDSLGIYPKSISITDGYQNSGSLGSITSTGGIDMFYFGIFNMAEPSLIQFTNAELDSLHEWSVRGGKLIIGAGSPVPSFPFLPDVLNSRWGFDLALLAPSPVLPTAAGLSSTLFTGPFGNVTQANQGGTSQGYFSTHPADIVTLADDGAGHPTMYLDCATLDLVVADGDVYTQLGNISFGDGILTSNDQLWANTIAYMDALEGPPIISQNGNQLSTGTYNSYQWYWNGNPISGANTNSYTATQPGDYSVHVALACGCNSVASQNVLIVGVNEIADKSEIFISPNPAGNLGITFNGVTRQLSVSVFTIDGRLVDEFNINSHQKHFNTDKLEQGVYFLKLYDMNGNLVSGQKLIKD